MSILFNNFYIISMTSFNVTITSTTLAFTHLAITNPFNHSSPGFSYFSYVFNLLSRKDSEKNVYSKQLKRKESRQIE